MNQIKKIIQSISSLFQHSNEIHLNDLRQFLNERQFKVIKYKLNGYTNREIAHKLDVCPATITNEMYRIRALLLEKGYKELLGDYDGK